MVLRSGTADPVSGATVSVMPAQTTQAYDTLVKASESIVLVGVRESLPELLTLSVDEFKDAMTQVKGMALPPGFVTALNDLQTAKAATPGFPKHALTDSTGHFTVMDVPPGRYTVAAQHDGFFGKPVAGSDDLRPFESAPAAVAAGQTTPDISIALLAGATIGGRVFDPNGAPAINVDVMAYSVIYQNGLPVLNREVVNQTDDRGVYRLFFLPPGEYFVAASLPQLANGVNAANASTSADVVVKTYFPNLVSPLMSTPVPVKLGDETAGVDIRMQSVHTAKISGTVINNLGEPPQRPDGTKGTFPNANVLILQHDNAIPDSTGARVIASIPMTQPTAPFTANGILPGIYDLYGRINDPRGSQGQGGAANAWGHATIEVRDKDIDSIALVVHPSVDVKGVMTMNGGVFNGQANPGIKVSLQPDGSTAKFPNYQGVQGRAQSPDYQGLFAIPGVAEGAYRVQILNLSKNEYIEEIRQGGQLVFDSGIQVGEKTPDLIEVMVNTNGGTIEGNVMTADHKPSVSSTVVLIPDASHRQNTTLFKVATTDAMGHYSIRGIRPGNYSLLAWQSVPVGAYLNPGFLSKYEGRTKLVNVAPQSTNTEELTVIPKN